MHFLRHDIKPFVSSIFKNKLSHTDKSDPENIKLPLFIENINERKLNKIIQKILKRYKQKNYTLYNREELHKDRNWPDIHFIILFMFYKKRRCVKIDPDDVRFPHFISTFTLKPLQHEIDTVIAKVYDKINSEASKDQLKNTFTYTALDLTYILYYLTLIEDIENKG